MRLRLLVDATEFRDALADGLAASRRTVFLQALTFEGDAAGRGVADLLARAPARDRRLLVDCFTRHVLSDRFRWRPCNLVSFALWRRRGRATDRGPRGRGVPRRGLPRHVGGARPDGLAAHPRTLHALDGRDNETAFEEVLELLAAAREEIFLEWV